jgi:hypothetical protein
MFTRTDLDLLLAHDKAPALSITLPTHAAGREIRQDPVRLRNLAGAVLDRLTSRGLRRPDAERLLRPVADLIRDEEFWRRQDRGLAVFVADGVFQAFRVPLDLEERVVVGSGFDVLPLLPLLAEDAPFLVLAVSAGNARLFQGGRFDLREVTDAPIPRGVNQIAAETDYQNTLHANPAVRHAGRRDTAVSAAKTHNFGETPEEQRKAQLIEYLHRVAAGVDGYMGSNRVPLVLAAQPEVRGNLLSLGQFRHHGALELDVNPDALDEPELQRRAYDAVRPVLTRERDGKIEHFKSLFNDDSPKSTGKLENAVRASCFAQVDTLLVRRGTRMWGRYDRDGDQVTVHGEARDGDEDLVCLAAKQTLRHGGQVFLVDGGHFRSGQIVGAILRFEQPKH